MKNKKLVILIAIGISVLGSNNLITFANSTQPINDNKIILENNSQNNLEEFQKEINNELADKMNDFIEKNKLNVKIENPKAKITQEVLEEYNYDKNVIKDVIRKDVTDFQNYLLNVQTTKEELKLMEEQIKDDSRIVHKGTYYTAKVFSGVPAIGLGYINQDFKATIAGSSRLTRLDFLGNSYPSGFNIGSWTHNRSWYNVNSYGDRVEINMKGVIKYKLGVISYDYPSTFIDYGKVEGGKIVNL